MAGKVKVVEATFGRVFNLGHYETFRVELKATVGPAQTPEEVVEALDEMTVKMRNRHKGELDGR
jgi:proteasome assembly chaperone (PAC2) family protein